MSPRTDFRSRYSDNATWLDETGVEPQQGQEVFLFCGQGVNLHPVPRLIINCSCAYIHPACLHAWTGDSFTFFYQMMGVKYQFNQNLDWYMVTLLAGFKDVKLKLNVMLNSSTVQIKCNLCDNLHRSLPIRNFIEISLWIRAWYDVFHYNLQFTFRTPCEMSHRTTQGQLYQALQFAACVTDLKV